MPQGQKSFCVCAGGQPFFQKSDFLPGVLFPLPIERLKLGVR